MDMEFVIKLSDIIPFIAGFVLAMTLLSILRSLLSFGWAPLPIAPVERRSSGGCLTVVLMGAGVLGLLLMFGAV
jgi:hypothetical protein